MQEKKKYFLLIYIHKYSFLKGRLYRSSQAEIVHINVSEMIKSYSYAQQLVFKTAAVWAPCAAGLRINLNVCYLPYQCIITSICCLCPQRTLTSNIMAHFLLSWQKCRLVVGTITLLDDALSNAKKQKQFESSKQK